MDDPGPRTIDRLVDALDEMRHIFDSALDCPAKVRMLRGPHDKATWLATDIRTQLEARALDDAALATYTEVTP